MVLFVVPDYLPEPPFWAAALRAERIVLLTGVQYVRQSRHNRAKIRNAQGVQWLTIPVRRGQLGASIGGTEISSAVDWWRHHRKALRYNYGASPFYDHYAADMDALDLGRRTTIGEVATAVIRHLRAAFGVVAEVAVDPVPRGALPAGGLLVGEDASWSVRVDLPPYRQVFEGFVGGLSALDLLFNHGPRARDLILGGSDLEPAPAGLELPI